MKKIFFLALIMSLNSLYAQKTDSEGTVNEFTIESNDIQKLKDFKWKKVKRFFQNNEKNDSIKIIVKFNKIRERDLNTVIQLDKTSAEIKGKTYELKKMIRAAKKSIKAIEKIEKD